MPVIYVAQVRSHLGDAAPRLCPLLRRDTFQNGRLFEILRDTMRFLNIYLMRPHHIQGLEPELNPEVTCGSFA